MEAHINIDLCYIFVDTTGLSPEHDSIIGIATKQRGKPIHYVRFQPEKEPHGKLAEINGYGQDCGGLKLTTGALAKTAKAMDGRVIVGHNLPFHLGFLRKAFDRFGVRIPYTRSGMVDLMSIFTPLSLLGIVNGISMDCLASSFGLPVSKPIDAKGRLEQSIVILDQYVENL